MSIKAEYLVVDSVGFLKNAPLRELATNLVTLTEVVGELRDKETRQRLEVMPFDLTYRQPSAEAVKRLCQLECCGYQVFLPHSPGSGSVGHGQGGAQVPGVGGEEAVGTC